MFSVDGQGDVHKSELNLLDGNSIESADKIFSFSGEHFSFKKGSSPDSSRYFLLCESHDTKDKNNSYAGVIMDKGMNVLNKFSFTAYEERDDVLSTEYLLSNSGTLVLIRSVKQKTNKKDFTPITYVAQQVGSNGKTSTYSLTGLPDGLLDHVAWQLKENDLYFAGLLAKKKKSDFTSIINGEFNLAERKLSNIKETEFAKVDYLQTSSDKYINDVAKSGIPAEVSLLSTFYNKDGSSYLLYEVNNTRDFDAYGPYLAAGGAFGTRSQFGSRTDYTTGNIFVAKLTATKQLEWLRIIGKNQIEPASNKYVGPVYLKDSEDRIHLIFHDDVQNTQAEPQKKMNRAELEKPFRRAISMASVQIDKSGNLKKQFIYDNQSTDYFLSPRDFVTKQNNQFIYTSYRYRNAGKSSYRLGTIMIK